MASQQACIYGVVRRTESIPAAAASSYWREKADHASSTSSPPDSRQLPCTDGQCATDYHAPTLGRRLDYRLFTHPRTELVHMILQGYSASFYPSRCTVERKPVCQVRYLACTCYSSSTAVPGTWYLIPVPVFRRAIMSRICTWLLCCHI